MNTFKEIAIFGAGYVGMSLATMFSQKLKVTIIDTDNSKIQLLNQKKSPIKDSLIENFFETKKLDLLALTEIPNLNGFDLIILALPTNFCNETQSFDTRIIEHVVEKIHHLAYKQTILIKATVPIGFTETLRQKFKTLKIIFSPEFLREGFALEDNLNPSRIIIGDEGDDGKALGNLFMRFTQNKPSLIYMSNTEAEAVKLFSNAYLAMRVSFFNELDTFCLVNDLNSFQVITGLSLDSRIGSQYNNPSFGYGGYCLPKDTKQLESNFKNIPQSLISATIESNNLRKLFISSYVLKKKPKTVGIFRLIMKENSDNFREAAILDLIKIFLDHNLEVVVFEPLAKEEIPGTIFLDSIDEFKDISSVILANRFESSLEDVAEKVITRDILC